MTNSASLVDTHCHLNFHAFDDDRLEVLSASKQAGIQWIVNPAVDLESSRAVISLAEKFPEIYAAVGVHPNDAKTWSNSTIDELRELAKHPKVVAIGEIGLDYYRDFSPKVHQQEVLLQQLELAKELGLPVIIHNRQATDDIMDIINRWTHGLEDENLLSDYAGVLHSYSGSIEFAHKAIECGFFIGISGPVTFKNALQFQYMVSQLPLDRLLVETDSPFLTPHPFRGRRNEPAYVRLITEKIAELQEYEFDKIANLTTANAQQLFRRREQP